MLGLTPVQNSDIRKNNVFINFRRTHFPVNFQKVRSAFSVLIHDFRNQIIDDIETTGSQRPTAGACTQSFFLRRMKKCLALHLIQIVVPGRPGISRFKMLVCNDSGLIRRTPRHKCCMYNMCQTRIHGPHMPHKASVFKQSFYIRLLSQ